MKKPIVIGITETTKKEMEMVGWTPPIPVHHAVDKADFVVCAFTEDAKISQDRLGLVGLIETKCAMCRADIAHRPHAPPLAAKICIPCFEAKLRSAT